MSGEPTFEARLWRLAVAIWTAVAVAAFGLVIQTIMTSGQRGKQR